MEETDIFDVQKFKQELNESRAKNIIEEGRFIHYMEKCLSNKERIALVGKNMKNIREQAGIAQRELCRLLMISPQTYNGYETGRHEPNIETLVRLSYLLGVSLDDLCGIEPEKYDKGLYDEDGNIFEMRSPDELVLRREFKENAEQDYIDAVKEAFPEILKQMEAMQRQLNELSGKSSNENSNETKK